MAQSPSLAAFFAPRGELDEMAHQVSPLTLGRYHLALTRCRLDPDEDGDVLVGTFQLTRHGDRGEIADILQQDVMLMHLPRAVAEDVYQLRGGRLWIAPETVKTRVATFLRGLAHTARTRHEALGDRTDLTPSSFV